MTDPRRTTSGTRPSTPHHSSPGSRRSRRDLPSIKELVTDLRDDTVRLVKGEIALAKAEMGAKAKSLGVGAGLLVGALILVLFGFGTLLAAAVLGLALVMPAWLAALIVGGALILIAVVLALIGVNKLKKGAKPVPERSLEALGIGQHRDDDAHTDPTSHGTRARNEDAA
jgi:hypothetical protein